MTSQPDDVRFEINSVMPAPGWRAFLLYNDGTPYEVPVVGWGLIWDVKILKDGGRRLLDQDVYLLFWNGYHPQPLDSRGLPEPFRIVAPDEVFDPEAWAKTISSDKLTECASKEEENNPSVGINQQAKETQ